MPCMPDAQSSPVWENAVGREQRSMEGRRQMLMYGHVSKLSSILLCFGNVNALFMYGTLHCSNPHGPQIRTLDHRYPPWIIEYTVSSLTQNLSRRICIFSQEIRFFFSYYKTTLITCKCVIMCYAATYVFTIHISCEFLMFVHSMSLCVYMCVCACMLACVLVCICAATVFCEPVCACEKERVCVCV